MYRVCVFFNELVRGVPKLQGDFSVTPLYRRKPNGVKTELMAQRNGAGSNAASELKHKETETHGSRFEHHFAPYLQQ